MDDKNLSVETTKDGLKIAEKMFSLLVEAISLLIIIESRFSSLHNGDSFLNSEIMFLLISMMFIVIIYKVLNLLTEPFISFIPLSRMPISKSVIICFILWIISIVIFLFLLKSQIQINNYTLNEILK